MPESQDSNNLISKKSVLSRSLTEAFLLSLVLICLFVSPVLANSAVNGSPESLIIGTKLAPPFAFKNQDGEWDGISIQLWKIMADDLGINYVFKEYDLKGLLNSVENNSVDAAVAALTITAEREKRFDFSHPFHTSGLGIAVRQGGKKSLLAVFHRFFSLEFLRVVLGLALLLLTVGVLVWLFEKKKNKEQFGGSALAGVGSGFWWSAVTMTTVGYGDTAPKTFSGRIIGIVWMFMAIIIISSFTAAMTSTLTVSQIQSHIKGPEDLHRVKVGSLKDSTSALYLGNNHISFQDYPTVKDALNGILSGEVDAVVYDSPILKYLAAGEMQGKVHVLQTSFEKQQYGIGLPTASPLREKVNRLIPEILGRKEWRDILFRYLGEPAL